MSGRGVVLHDFLYCQGGAERVTQELTRGLEADLAVAFVNQEVFPPEELAALSVREIGRAGARGGRSWRTLHGLRAFRRSTAFLAAYDWAIFSGTQAPMGVHSRPSGRNLYYCHTLPRFAYDRFAVYRRALPAWKRPFFDHLTRYVRARYEEALGRMDAVVANSENVRNRLQRYIGLEARVVPPPCDVAGYQWQGQSPYYLSTARLEPYKRVDRLIEAFRALPDRQLVIASGGSDYQRLTRLAAGAENIRFTGWLDENALKTLVGNAIATLYIPVDEDFGMAPVESMAAGKPVIGVAEGGLLETVRSGETGWLLPPDPSPEMVREAVRAVPAEVALAMRPACEKQAARFSRERFLAEMGALLAETPV